MTNEHAEVGAVMQSLQVSETGESLAALSAERPVFAVLLRHAGCTFHREALADLQRAKAAIEGLGLRLVVVHMSRGENPAEQVDPRYALGETLHVADPERRLYRALGVPRGGIGQLFGWSELRRGFSACLLERHGVGALRGDGLQLGGLALLAGGEVVWRRPLDRASERPDYAAEAQAAVAAMRAAAE